ncbi:hypothetical protein QS468_16005 [Bacillus subtilis]|nr:hypothetical protein [Pseudomonas sp. A29(2023)]MDL5594220.1 hypothetical protein [Bacillus subtilis]
MDRPAPLNSRFWHGYLALLLAFAAGQLGPQIDLAVLARASDGQAGLYALLTRLALLELVVTMALGTALSVMASQAQRAGRHGEGLRPALVLAGALGVPLGLLGALAGLGLLPMLLHSEAAQLPEVMAALPWFFLATPLRLLNGCAGLLLHARGEGRQALRIKGVELLVRLVLDLALVLGFGAGLSGCFIAGLLLNLGTCAWLLRHLARASPGQPWRPQWAWCRQALLHSGWESQRVLAIQAFGLAAVTLVAMDHPWPESAGRLDGFSAVLTLGMLMLSPLNALLRFLALRLAAGDPVAIRDEVRRRALPVAAVASVGLLLATQALGQLYGQSGPWWTTGLLLLALSLPLRVLGNLQRAQYQAAGRFAEVGRLEAAALWLVGLPVLLAGLALDCPPLAYAYLLLPELCVITGLHSRKAWASVAEPGERTEG